MANSYFDLDRWSRPDSEPTEVTETPANSLLHGVKPFADLIRRSMNGGLGLAERPLEESSYDEEKTDVLDPTTQFGSDRFERSEAIASLVSEEAARHKRSKLEHADV